MPASARWLEVSTHHFIIYADTSEARAREFAERLERFDQGLRRLFVPPQAEDEGRRSNRLRVYVVDNASVVRELCGGCANVMGFYHPRVGGSVVFTPLHAGAASRSGLTVQSILLHEYTHHYLFANFPAAYPAWFSEGLAEVGSTARFKSNGELDLGLPLNARAYSLLEADVLDAEQLLSTDKAEFDAIQLEAMYSRGWLLTHYLLFSHDGPKQLTEYLRAINNGTSSLDAGKAAFGDLKDLDHELDRYVRARTMPMIKMPGKGLSVGRIDIRPLSEGAAAMMRIHMRSTNGVTREMALELLTDARQVGTRFPNDPVVQVQLAEAEFDAGNLDEAEAAADRAIAADSSSIKGFIYKGAAQVNRAALASVKDEETWRLARSWFVKANRVDPDAAEPLLLFYESFNSAGLTPTDNAVVGLKRAFELAPEDPRVRARVAIQALRDDDLLLAHRALAPIAFSPHASRMRDTAAAAMALVDARKTSEALDTLLKSRKDDGDKADGAS